MANKKDNVRFEDFEAFIKDLENSPEEQEKLLEENGIDKDRVYSEAEDFAKRMSAKKPGKVICIQQEGQPIKASKCKKKITITIETRLVIRLSAALAASVILCIFVKSYLFHTDKPNIPQTFAKKTEPVLNRDTRHEAKEAVQNTIPNRYDLLNMLNPVNQNKLISSVSGSFPGTCYIYSIGESLNNPAINTHANVTPSDNNRNDPFRRDDYINDSNRNVLNPINLTCNQFNSPNEVYALYPLSFCLSAGVHHAGNSATSLKSYNWKNKFFISNNGERSYTKFFVGSHNLETEGIANQTIAITKGNPHNVLWTYFDGDGLPTVIFTEPNQELQSTSYSNNGVINMFTYDACNRMKSISHHTADGNSYFFSFDGKEVISPDVQNRDVSICQGASIKLIDNRNTDLVFKSALNNSQEIIDSSNTDYITEVASLFNNLGTVYQKGFKLNDSEEAYKKALDIYERMRLMNPDKFEESLASTLSNLASLYSIKNNLTAAETCYSKASEIYKRLATSNPKTFEPELASLYSRMGLLYNKTNDLQKAEMLYRRALDIYQRLAIKIPGNP